jgi:hypothetical protein
MPTWTSFPSSLVFSPSSPQLRHALRTFLEHEAAPNVRTQLWQRQHVAAAYVTFANRVTNCGLSLRTGAAALAELLQAAPRRKTQRLMRDIECRHRDAAFLEYVGHKRKCYSMLCG